jgi:N-methylhydantoinase A
MQSSGGLATAKAMTTYPVRMIESGPAAGALMAARYGELTDHSRVVAFDMGGTTAKLALVVDGAPEMVNQFELHKVGHAAGSGIPMNVTSLDLTEIGSGGGSIARPNLGTIQVGPDSAGSQPGPACYGLGGEEPTVTDANLVLGYLNPNRFAGGQMTLDTEAAERAIRTRVAEPLGMGLEDAAWGIHRMVNLTMELATRVVSIERGHDPRGLALVATGGSGPVHCCRLAQALGLPTVIIPAAAGVASALGMLSADVKFDLDRTHLSDLTADDLPGIDAMLEEMVAEGTEFMQNATGRPPARIEREVELRYAGQGYELSTAIPDRRLSEDGALGSLRESFEEEYSRRYGFANEAGELEATTWKVTFYGSRRPLELPSFEAGSEDGASAARETRRAYFPETEGYVEVPVYVREELRAGATFDGPAIVEESGSTTVLPPATSATVDSYGNLVVTIA